MPLETEIPWTYTRNPGQATVQQRRDDVRFKCGDTEDNDPQFSDGEVDGLLADAGDNTLVAAIAGCDRLQARYARHQPVTQGGVSVGGGRADQYANLAKTLRRGQSVAAGGGFFAGGRTKSGKRAQRRDRDAVQPAFAIGMDDISGSSHNSNGNLGDGAGIDGVDC